MEHNTDPRQKTALYRFFSLWIENFGMLVPINFLYSLLSAPLIPCGLAQAGITNVARNIARQRHSFGISDFMDTVKSNWRQALVAGILNLLMTALLCFGILFYYNSEGIVADVALGVLTICLVVFSFMKYYIWLLIITFRLPLGSIYKNSFLLAFVNFKRNLFVGVVELAVYAALVLIAILLPHFLVLFLATVFAVFIMPGFLQLLIQWNIFPAVRKYMIDPYYENHPEEDLDLRRSLSLETGEQSGQKQEPIFKD